MKKGFISVLILLILEEKECHGYQIGKEIGNRTLGVWEPPASTLYTVLNNMAERELISYREQSEAGRLRKVCSITPKGEETLKGMLEKYLLVKKAFGSLISSTLGVDESLLAEGFKHNDFLDVIFNAKKMNTKEKLQVLRVNKAQMSRKIKDAKEQLEGINKAISELEKLSLTSEKSDL